MGVEVYLTLLPALRTFYSYWVATCSLGMRIRTCWVRLIPLEACSFLKVSFSWLSPVDLGGKQRWGGHWEEWSEGELWSGLIL